MNKWILLLLNFLTFSIVEDGAGVADEAKPESEAEATETIVEEEAPSVADQAWDAVENSTEVEPETDAVEKPEEIKVEEPEVKPETVKTEEQAKPEAITEDDLKPLDSKNPKTNERFQKVTEGYKTEKARADALVQENTKYKESFDSLKQLGFSDATAAEDLVEFSAYRHVLATGDAEQFKGIIEEQIKQFESIHGKRINVNASVLDNYPDIKKQVDDLDLDENIALEVARARAVQARAERDNKLKAEGFKTQEQQQAIVSNAVEQVKALENTWRTTDPDYNVIKPHLAELINELGSRHAPEFWASSIELQYKTLKKALSQTARESVKKVEPLRGNGHLTGKPAPTSVQEATLAAMGFD